MRRLLGQRWVWLLLAGGLALGLIVTFWYRRQQTVQPVIIPREEKTIRILEGWTNQDIAKYLEAEGLFPAADFLALVGSDQGDKAQKSSFDLEAARSRFSWLPEEGSSLEGYLFPDTYRVFATSSPQEVVQKMLDNFDRKLSPEMRAEAVRRQVPLKDIVIMASLIEKEAPIVSGEEGDRDARLISGVFYNRLKIGQALQSDATLSYIFNDNKPQHSGAELEVDSLYNSYKYPGLPPGPISNPGLKAIQAAIYPADTDYYYFLTPRDSLEVIYARNYSEHLQNKYKYLR